MSASIASLIAHQENDASAAEASFRAATGLELIRGPIESMHVPASLTASVSVLIPAWNAGATLPACLTALERSTFNRAAPHFLEVVVIDDGSSDGTWNLLQDLPLSLDLKLLRKPHGASRAQAQNSALAYAEGAIAISCDADVVLAPFAIEEFARRLQLCPGLFLIGFYADIPATAPAVAPDNLESRLFAVRPPIERDGRRGVVAAGWPENPVRDSDHLGRLGKGRLIYDARGRPWDAAHMVYGGLFAMRRDDWLAVGGYDERFVGWGSEDTFLGAKALANGLKIVPTYSATGWHVAHLPRSSDKEAEAAANRARYAAALHEPWRPSVDSSWLARAASRVEIGVSRAASTSPPPIDRAAFLAPYRPLLDDPGRRGSYLMSVGRYDEAADCFARVNGTTAERASALANQGRALWSAGRTRSALELWTLSEQEFPPSPRLLVELAMATAELGDAAAGRAALERALDIDAHDALARFVIRRSADDHLRRGDLQAANGHVQLALREYTAALLRDPDNHEGRAKADAIIEARPPSIAAASPASPAS